MRAGRVAALLVVAVAIGVGVVASRRAGPSGEAAPSVTASVPLTTAVRGVLEIDVRLKGELRATKQVNLPAPSVGGLLRILDIRETGERVSAGDVLVEFDPAEQLYALEQARSELLEAEQEIIKLEADATVQEAEDRVALITARFDVRRAELDVAVDRDLIPANDYRIREVSFDEAKRHLTQVEQDVKSRAATSRAALAVLQERRAKAQMSAARAEQAIASLVLTAPIDGVVSVRQNLSSLSGPIFSLTALPTYRVGDDVSSGRPLIDVLDVTALEIAASVNEEERSNLAVGQRATVEPAAMPGVTLEATVAAISGIGRALRNAGPLRQFEVTLELSDSDDRLKPGTSVEVRVVGERVEDQILVPRQAVFEREGKPVVFVRGASGLEAVEVKVRYRTATTAALEGLEAGARVALVDPERVAAAGAVARAPGGRP